MSSLIQHSPSLPSVQEFQTLKELGQMAIKSGFLPQGIKTSEQAIIIMLKGRELGVPPMQAFSSIAVIQGKPTMSAELMLSMIYRNVPGAIVNFIETTNEKCVIEAKRPGGKSTTFSFTMEDARRANLTGKGPWITYPGAMLRARCASAMARAMFPDALSGVVYTPEELGAEVDDSGEIISIPSETIPEAVPVNEAKPLPKPSPVQEKVSDPGSFTITFGKWKGSKIKDQDPAELANYVAYLEEGARLQNKPIQGVLAQFILNAEAFLSQGESEPA